MRPGDCYVTNDLPSTDEKIKGHQAIILKCPFCGLDMASTYVHKILRTHSWFEFWKRWCGYRAKITIPVMLQCPYNSSHKFKIKKGRILEL